MSDENEVTPPRFVAAEGRSEAVSLEWSVEYAGKIYSSVTVRRMTAGEVATFVEHVRSLPPTERYKARFPMFDVPDAVLDMLDADDDERLGEVVGRFLPRRFRAATDNSPASAAGDE